MNFGVRSGLLSRAVGAVMTQDRRAADRARMQDAATSVDVAMLRH